MEQDIDTTGAVNQLLANQQRDTVRVNVAAAAGTNADLEAELRAASQRTGVPIGSARVFPQVVQRRAEIDQLNETLQRFPSTMAFMAQEGNARLAHDDSASLTTIETLVNSFKRGMPGLQQNLSATALRANAGILSNVDAVEAKLRAGETVLDTEDPYAVRFMSDEQRAAFRASTMQAAGGAAGTIAEMQARKALLPQPPVVDAVMQAKGWGEALRAFMGDPVKFIASIGPESLVQNAPAIAAAVPAGMAGGPWAAASVMGAGSFGVDYGASLLDGLARAGVDLKDPSALTAAAQDTQLMRRVAAQAMAHASVVGGVDALSGGVASKLAIPARAANALATKPLARELANVGAQIPVQGAMGGLGEAGGQTAAGLPLDPGNILAEIVGEAFSAPAEVASVAAGQVRERMRQGAEVRAEVGALGKLMEAARDSKLRGRDPDAFAAFVQQAAEKGQAPAEVYVDAQAFAEALQQSGITLEQAVAAMPALEAQLEEVSSAGGDLVIPVGEFAAGVAGSPLEQVLMQHVRTTPANPTLAETDASEADTSALQNEVDAALTAADETAAAVAATDSVRDQVMQQLQTTGRFTADVNNAYAALVTSFYAAQAERTGVAPDVLFSEMPLRIVAESPAAAGASLDQAGEAPAGWGSVGPSDSPNNMPPGAMTRGLFSPSSNTITLLARADLSTFIHEGAHAFLEMSARMAAQPNAPDAVKADVQTLLDWFGHKGTVAEWLALPVDERRDAHEKFARGFEAYAMEGQAPSLELQGLFQRFRAWLLRVYHHLVALNVELSDEVRQVMGRMIATDDQIRAAEAARSFRPMFNSAEAAGMTADEWVAYQALGADATQAAVGALQSRSIRDMAWLANTKARKVRQLAKDAEGKRKEVRAEVEAEVRQQPIYAVQRFLSHGELAEAGRTNAERRVIDSFAGGGTKLDLPALKALYGDGPAALWRYLSTGKNGQATAQDGLSPDLVADLFGYTSGDHLVRAILAAEKESTLVDALTDQRMLERYGDLSSADAIERAADAAIHNDARARFLEREVNTLGKAVGNRPLLAKAARQFAEEAVARKKVRELRPAMYTAASTRAGRQADQAFKKGDTAGAAAAKRTQLLQHQLARVATRAQAEATQAAEYLRKFDSAAVRKVIDGDYVDQIEALLERYDLRASTTGKTITRRKSLAEWIEAQRELGFEPVIDERLAADAQQRHFTDITVEELRGLVDTVRNIEHLGRLKKKLLTVQDQRAFDAIVSDTAESIRGNATRRVKQGIETALPSDRIKKLAASFIVSHRKLASLVRQMDGGKDGGPLWSVLVQNMNRAGDTESSMRAEATAALSKLFAPLNKAAGLYRKTYIPEIGGSLTRAGRLSVALNWGNDANRQRVLDGDGWTMEQAQAVLATLTREDWTFVQSVWDYLNSYWPQIEAKEKRVSGVAPGKVEAAPFSARLADGSTVELQGGYYPLAYDPERSTKAGADTTAEAIKQAMQGLYTRATTRRGHTKARVETVNRPLRKDLGVIFQHVEQVTHDLAWHEFLIDANRLLRAKPIDAAIRDHYGPEVLRAMSAALTDIAAGDVPAQNAFEQSIAHLRAGVTVASMGWSLVTAAQQPLGLTQSMVRIGPKWVGRGLARWLGDASRMQSTVATIHERSTFMRLRAQNQNREIAEIRNRVRDSGQWKVIPPAVRDTFFYFTEKMQLVADVPTWLGQFEKSIAAGETEARAIALADQAVIDSQSSGGVKDLAKIQRGSPLQKLFTAFYSAFSATFNLTAESIARTKFTDPASVGRLAVDMLLLYTLPAVLGMLLKDALRGAPGEDDPEKLAVKLAREQLNYVMSTMVGVRELGAAVQGSFGYSGPAGTRFFSDMAKLGKQVQQGEADEALLKAANSAAGVLFHYPALQIERTVSGIEAVSEGTAGPRAILFGVPPKQ